MEFLIIFNAGPREAAAVKAMIAATPNRLSPVDGPLAHKMFGRTLVVAPRPCFDDDTNTAQIFDGHALMDDQLLAKAQEGAFLKVDAVIAAAKNQQTMPSGIFCAVKVEAKQLTLVTDALGQYCLMTSAFDDREFLSNSLPLIEAYLATLGDSPRRDMETALFELVVGTAPLDHTGLECVSLVAAPQNCIYATSTGKLVWQGPALDKKHPSHCSLEQAREKLVQRIGTVLRSQSNPVLDLTGGLDSRLVIAAALESGVKGWRVYRSSAEKNPNMDGMMRDSLIHHYALPVSDFPENFEGEEVTSLDMAKRAAFRHQGLASELDDNLGRKQLSGIVRIRGGVGEILRDFYRTPAFRFNTASLKKAWKNYRSCPDVLHDLHLGPIERFHTVPWVLPRLIGGAARLERLLTPEFQALVKKHIAYDVGWILAHGGERKALLWRYYLKSRSRRHFGATSQLRNLSHISLEPLADADLASFALGYSLKDRRNARPHYDLLRSFDPYLAAVPAAEKAEGLQPTSDFTVKPVPSCRSPVYKDRVAGLPPTLGQTSLAFLEELIAGLPHDHDLYAYFDRAALIEAVSALRRNEETGYPASLFHRLLIGLIWFERQEDPVGIESYCRLS